MITIPNNETRVLSDFCGFAGKFRGRWNEMIKKIGKRNFNLVEKPIRQAFKMLVGCEKLSKDSDCILKPQHTHMSTCTGAGMKEVFKTLGSDLCLKAFADECILSVFNVDGDVFNPVQTKHKSRSTQVRGKFCMNRPKNASANAATLVRFVDRSELDGIPVVDAVPMGAAGGASESPQEESGESLPVTPGADFLEESGADAFVEMGAAPGSPVAPRSPVRLNDVAFLLNPASPVAEELPPVAPQLLNLAPPVAELFNLAPPVAEELPPVAPPLSPEPADDPYATDSWSSHNATEPSTPQTQDGLEVSETV